MSRIAVQHESLWRLSLATAACLFAGIGIGRFGYTALVPALIDTGQVSETRAGLLGAFNLLGYLLGTLLAPHLIRRCHPVSVLKTCMVLALASLVLSSLPGGFAWLLPWRLLIGISAGVMMVGAVSLLLALASPRELARAAASLFTGVGTGIVLSGTLIPLLLDYGVPFAWAGLAMLVALALVLAWWGFPARLPAVAQSPPGASPGVQRTGGFTAGLTKLLLAHVLFGIGLMPHTLYWVDFIARNLDRGIAAGGFGWTLVGVGAFIGPSLCGLLARVMGFGNALLIAMLALATGVLLPNLTVHATSLVLSSLLFGIFNTGMSTLMSGRTRELSDPLTLARAWGWMSVAISAGQVIGGYLLVAVYEATGRIESVFVVGALALGFGFAVCLAGRSSR